MLNYIFFILQQLMDSSEPSNPNPWLESEEEDEFFGPRRQVPERMTAELVVNQFLASPRKDVLLVKDFPLIEKIFRHSIYIGTESS